MSLLVDQWFMERLDELNRKVARTGEPVEGNIFYEHHDADFPRATISKRFENKRQNLLAASRGRSHMLEIGVNAGHSALWLLHNNPQLTYTGVDIYEHNYTKVAAVFLKELFGDRVQFHAGNSLYVLPAMRVRNKHQRYDVIHIDGNHSLTCCMADTYNALSLASPDAWIIIDDTDLPDIKHFYQKLVADGLLKNAAPAGWIPDIHQAIGQHTSLISSQLVD